MIRSHTYVEFLYPGTLFPESTIKEVNTTDPRQLEIPERVFALQFFTRKEDRQSCKDEILKGKRVNLPGRVYIKGKLYSVDDIKQLIENGERLDTLLSNMESNKWPQIIRTHLGNWQPFEEDDKLLEEVK